MKKMIEEEEEGEGEEREEEEGEGEGEEEEEENKLQSRDLMSGWSAEEDCRLNFRVKRRWSFPLIRQHGRFRPYPQLAPCAVHIQVSKVLLHVWIELILLVNSFADKDYAEYVDAREGESTRKVWFMGGEVANHSTIIEDLKPQLIVWLRPAMRERFDFERPTEARLLMNLLSTLADHVGNCGSFHT